MYLKSSVVYIKAPPNTKKLRRLPGKLGRIHKSSAIYLKAPPYTWKAPPWARSGWELLPPPGSSQKCKSILSLKCIKCIFYNMSFINANCMLFFTKVIIIIKECFTYLHICKSYTSTLSYKYCTLHVIHTVSLMFISNNPQQEWTDCPFLWRQYDPRQG